ncbi:hypothetical protein NTGHW29_790003 [Candidatus Nitrotoga sp. HW29]|uniref:hypothetical protein n=1 Tax=Candidatus Nitrotoga sp. HW29 TaxID=2886963 RepID=UPI001EF1B111|nr:hypothetical protein [Candidatus Nitrotoga sp. HW29]CAH1906196.1 hypothetical protein NTGHW29_790003 [Candidatus Nitrotoga sp. HW29]
MISPQLKFDIKSEIIIDNFAGSECAFTGIKMPLGQHVAVENNHDQNRRPSILWMPERATTLTGTKSWLLRLYITHPRPHVARRILR